MVKVVFIHPDLGIGGAERAVVDAALALKSRGHSVTFFTAHHDPSHCFQETRDGTLEVVAVGDWLPRSVLGRCQALCAYIRMIYVAAFLVFFSGHPIDLIFCDQISACIPVLKWSGRKILFYCHFPDLLLTARTTALKRFYRAPIDWLEERTTGMADCILVNSKFTAGIFHQTFTSLQHMTPEVLYPIPDFSAFQKPAQPASDDLIPSGEKLVFLSINRYERKKNLALAIRAFGLLRAEKKVGHLVMAGGYDDRVRENVDHYQELKCLAADLDLGNHVTFLRSFSDAQKLSLLHACSCLLYTPDREHFGIVPIEAMCMRRPVIAVASGGPLETIADDHTGFLCPPEPEAFAAAMQKFVDDPTLVGRMGEKGKRRVEELFSFEQFTEKLDVVVKGLTAPES
ncbi:alpha-1,3/1,6-mannosyltransferase ALG2-like [Babylonia areolata]|uniref:alpha-1,3/1,6-mannosyltransferase ALG2-like n=1 Tax=Babylonia areolata TaxID=304850 RepID=UPI003FD56807